jgi:nicotinamide-nucleotide amidase
MLTVGRELLIGRTLNTNAHWVGRRLAAMGTMIARMATVDDNLGEISSAVKEALSRRVDFVIVVGGLGPTPDDMTLEGVARGLGTKLRLSGDALRLIKEHYLAMGRADFKITPSRRKMAVLPLGATALHNEKGTAPGVRIPTGGAVVFCLPGVPVEMKSIFRESVEGEIKKRVGKLFRKAARLKLEGIFESALAPLIGRELKKHPEAYIKSHPRGVKDGLSRIELDVVVVDEKKEVAERAVQEIVGELVRQIRAGGGRVRWARGFAVETEGG